MTVFAIGLSATEKSVDYRLRSSSSNLNLENNTGFVKKDCIKYAE